MAKSFASCRRTGWATISMDPHQYPTRRPGGRPRSAIRRGAAAARPVPKMTSRSPAVPIPKAAPPRPVEDAPLAGEADTPTFPGILAAGERETGLTRRSRCCTQSLRRLRDQARHAANSANPADAAGAGAGANIMQKMPGFPGAFSQNSRSRLRTRVTRRPCRPSRRPPPR